MHSLCSRQHGALEFQNISNAVSGRAAGWQRQRRRIIATRLPDINGWQHGAISSRLTASERAQWSRINLYILGIIIHPGMQCGTCALGALYMDIDKSQSNAKHECSLMYSGLVPCCVLVG